MLAQAKVGSAELAPGFKWWGRVVSLPERTRPRFQARAPNRNEDPAQLGRVFVSSGGGGI